jgi:hypothetical protein
MVRKIYVIPTDTSPNSLSLEHQSSSLLLPMSGILHPHHFVWLNPNHSLGLSLTTLGDLLWTLSVKERLPCTQCFPSPSGELHFYMCLCEVLFNISLTTRQEHGVLCFDYYCMPSYCHTFCHISRYFLSTRMNEYSQSHSVLSNSKAIMYPFDPRISTSIKFHS